MSKLIKIIRKSAVFIVLILLLLMVQAYSDLSLPSYTSDIVNVGIQQGGITTAYPTVIRKSQLDKFKLFATNDEVKTIETYYELVSPGSDSYTKLKVENSNLVNQDLYVIKDELTEKQSEELAFAISLPQMIVSAIGSSDMLPDFTELEGLPPKKRTALINSIRENVAQKITVNDSSTINQMGITLVKSEYEAIGMDTAKMQYTSIITIGLKMLALSALSMTASIFISFFASWVAARTGRDTRKLVFNRVLRFTNREFNDFSTASLITRSTNDIQQVQMFMVMLLRMMLFAPIMGIGSFIKVLNSNAKMSWIIGLAVALVILLVLLLLGFTLKKFQLLQKLIDRLNLVAREILTGLPVIRAFTNEKHEEERFDDANRNLTKTNLFLNRSMALMMPTMMLIMNAVTVLIVWVGAQHIDAGNLLVGELMAFIQYAMHIIMSFLMLSMTSIMFPRAIVSIKRIAEVLDKEISITDPKQEKALIESKKGVVEFKDVYFRYPNAQEDVLNNISFVAEAGKTTAFIGSTGSGKSTLINLIPRFFDVTGGKILVDGVDIREVSQKALRDKIGYVPQKGVLFSGTIASNISYSNPDMSEDDIKWAADIAQATEFIENTPDKFDNPISQGGANVSGGQKQRLSIARAISKKPDILIFDDSFSALDFKTDAKLRKALAESTSNATVLIVAQRISTVINADRIVVLDDGAIAGIGTHKELLKSCEVYQQIASSQLSKEELENE